MLKLALVFLAVAVVAGILGFVVNVAGAIAKILFVIFLIGFGVTLVPALMRGKGRDITKT